MFGQTINEARRNVQNETPPTAIVATRGDSANGVSQLAQPR